MEFKDFKKIMKRKGGTIFSITFLLVVGVMAVSLMGGLKYSAQSKLLVVQDTGSADAYTVSRSNEYLGNLLSEVVYSGSFFNLVVNNGQYRVDQDYFGNSYADKLKNWRQSVSTKTISDTGIIVVDVYHSNPDQARLISLVVNDVLISKNANYHGGSGVKVSILDQPLVSDYPDQPNILYNFIFALFLGIFISVMFIYLYPESEYDIRLWPKSKKKVRKIYVAVDNSEKKEENYAKPNMKDNIDGFSNPGDISGVLK